MAAGRAPLLLAATLLTTAAVGPAAGGGNPRSERTPATVTEVYAGQGSMAVRAAGAGQGSMVAGAGQGSAMARTVSAGQGSVVSTAAGAGQGPVADGGQWRGPGAMVVLGVAGGRETSVDRGAGDGRVPVRGWGGGRVPSPRPVPKVSVRPPVPPKGVTVGPTVKVPRVSVRRAPRPKVSISIPNVNRRAAPEITLPHVTIYPDGVCSGAVEVGECPRRRSRAEAREVVPPAPPASLVEPVRVPPPPTPTPSARSHVKRLEPPARRGNPLNTVLLTVALVTAISSTTAVAFRRTR
ncbi:hypothetical protein GCM10009733_107040 [Nonomuraea maheshkhaliensis]|uniref:Uncharacterized protein n=1 Tax=Nonomuraea maheshkhaliensis TaxID=419590 RepID=A0ABP4TWT9_9ACTN